MNPGELRSRIAIWHINGTTENEVGEEVPNVEKLATVWARVEALKGREYWEAQKIRPELTYKVLIRHRNDLTPDMTVEWENRELEVQSILPDAKKAYMQLICIEKVKPENG